MRNPEELGVATHLGAASQINLGSFYTPPKYVRLVAEWLVAHGMPPTATIADLAAGYGAFFELSSLPAFQKCRFIANDIDHEALEKGRRWFPTVEWHEGNALENATRGRYGIGDNEHLVVVGNPPYNDVTSEVNHGVKAATKAPRFDKGLATRDLGMSFLLSFDRLRADHVAVLHPLSYLIKKANYQTCRPFFHNYRMLEHVVFPSSEFAGTSRTSAFPVVVALYKRVPLGGISYDDIRRFTFQTVEGNSFSLGKFDYVTDHIDKYPGNGRFEPEILFYTLRDINALKRSQTFLPRRIPNAVDVNPAKLPYYCYVDCFKRYAQIPYYLGNFNIPFIADEFDGMANLFVKDASFHHSDLFGQKEPPTQGEVDSIRNYIDRSLQR